MAKSFPLSSGSHPQPPLYPGVAGSGGGLGEPGLMGLPGAEGPEGPVGAQGGAGVQGVPGLLGLPGAEGPAGPQGPSGVNGAAGATGATGTSGLLGLPGPQGPGGPQGAAGANGSDGAPGPQGTQGAQGFAGLLGLPGPAGVPGVGTAGRIPIWTSGNALSDSILSQSATALVVDGAIDAGYNPVYAKSFTAQGPAGQFQFLDRNFAEQHVIYADGHFGRIWTGALSDIATWGYSSGQFSFNYLLNANAGLDLHGKELRWGLDQYMWSTAPHAGISPNSIKVWDQYGDLGGAGNPSAYGTLLDIYGRDSHNHAQLYFDNSGKILTRNAFYSETTWRAWRTLLDSSTFNDYAPKLDGTGAVGTWGININGNATNGFSWQPAWAQMQNLTADLTDFNAPAVSGFYNGYAATGAPGATYYSLLNIRHANPSNQYGMQLAMSFYDETLWSRSINNGTPTAWRSHLHSGNYGSYALPISGGSVTGTAWFTGYDALATALYVYNAGSSAGNWRGRAAFGGDGSRVVLGESSGRAILGAHSPGLTAWAPLYINYGSSQPVIVEGDPGGAENFRVGGNAYFSDYVRTNAAYVYGWFNNYTSGCGLYNQANNNHLFSDAPSWWNLTTAGVGGGGLRIRDTTGGAAKGHLYFDGSGFGLLNDIGGWAVRAKYGASYGGALTGAWDVGSLTLASGMYAPSGDVRALTFTDHTTGAKLAPVIVSSAPAPTSGSYADGTVWIQV